MKVLVLENYNQYEAKAFTLQKIVVVGEMLIDWLQSKILILKKTMKAREVSFKVNLLMKLT